VLKSKLFCAASLAFAVPCLAAAQTAAPPQTVAAQPDAAGSVAATSVARVVVTAHRSPAPADQVGVSVTVLTLPQIQLDQETTVSDLLARTPGIDVARNGGPGEATSVFIRGADSDHTLVLIDGVKVNDPSDAAGGYDFANLMTGDVARIEVLRGAQSTLYGSEAIGGVINVVTADATKPLEGALQIEGGSFGTGYINGAIGGKTDRLNWRAGLYYDTTDGISAAAGGTSADAFHAAGFSGRARYDLTPDLQIDERIYYSADRAEFDGYDTPTGAFGDDEEFGRVAQAVDYTGLNWSLFDGQFNSRFAVEYADLDRRNEDPQQPETKYSFTSEGRATTLEYEGTYAVAPGYQAVFGASTEHSTIDADSPYFDLLGYSTPARAGAVISSGYAQLSGEVIKGLNLTGGLRYDDHSTFGGHLTGGASAAWSLNGGSTILRASYGQGFKAPSLYELYSQYGDPTLKPEQAQSWDAGVEQHFLSDRIVVQATYFGRDTHDLIAFGYTAQHPGGGYENIDKANAEGLELQGLWHVDKALDLSANYTFDDDENRSPGSPTLGQQLARRPKNLANWTATYVWPVKLSTSVAVRYSGRSFDSDPNTGAPAIDHAYTLLDLRASYPLRTGLELYGRIENATDTHYETADGYGTPGRAGYAGVRATF
jgi:vitamin B12 transporter